ncbi:hypothetical protein PROFUN_13487 [Planoprotostelium fungivorum]|uniref:Uncharacterized protein n=1 Tax=Planoprotostelium fungivorum TaxID=1890364 RepID=A0A2P6N3X2_9EUKA|nr:hypothetical protein PROFUN_13487 [Planoprotostelium fungivorum]
MFPHRESNPGLKSESLGCYRYTIRDCWPSQSLADSFLAHLNSLLISLNHASRSIVRNICSVGASSTNALLHPNGSISSLRMQGFWIDPSRSRIATPINLRGLNIGTLWGVLNEKKNHNTTHHNNNMNREESSEAITLSWFAFNLMLGFYGFIWIFGTVLWFYRLRKRGPNSFLSEPFEEDVNWFSRLRDRMMAHQRQRLQLPLTQPPVQQV